VVNRSLSVAMAGFAAALLVGAGCSAEDPQPPPVPQITAPKRLIGTDPCVLLDEPTRTRLGLGQGVPGQDMLGASCRWGGQDSLSVQLTAYTSGTGLSDLAKAGDASASRVRLSGYPALETFTTGGRFCRYDVGLAEVEALVATMDGGAPDSCTALQELLTAVISRLPASG
jgi:hypothetical protein